MLRPAFASTQGEIEKRQYLYIFCSAAGTFLTCRVPKEPPTEDLTMFQTCPLYDEYFDTPLVIAN